MTVINQQPESPPRVSGKKWRIDVNTEHVLHSIFVQGRNANTSTMLPQIKMKDIHLLPPREISFSHSCCVYCNVQNRIESEK